MTHTLITRQEAKNRGDYAYFTGIPCKHGHIALRRVRGARCLECRKVGVKKYIKAHPERNRAYTQASREKYALTHDGRQYNYDYWRNPANKLKNIARARVRTAVRNGTLIPESCKCGALKTEAHHPDYTKPLEVVWLCSACHKAEHVRLDTLI
jgi:hypothetical protein